MGGAPTGSLAVAAALCTATPRGKELPSYAAGGEHLSFHKLPQLTGLWYWKEALSGCPGEEQWPQLYKEWQWKKILWVLIAISVILLHYWLEYSKLLQCSDY